MHKMHIVSIGLYSSFSSCPTVQARNSYAQIRRLYVKLKDASTHRHMSMMELTSMCLRILYAPL